MRNFITAGAVGLVLSAPVSAQAAVSEQEVAELKQQVQALLSRVQQLEAQNSQLAATGAAPAAAAPKVEELEARVAEIESTNDRQTDQLAQAAAKDKSMDWATKLKFKGDLRYRHEMIDEETKDDQTRHRIRARLGVEAKVADNVLVGLQIATGDPLDPRSTNSTLGDSNIREQIQMDLAYVDWRFMADTTLTAGKQKYPWYRPGASLFYDGDVNPEGVGLKWGGKTGPFASAWGLWLSESSSGADANIFGAQLGWATDFGLKVALSYHDYGAIQRSSLLFKDYPAGNTTYNGDTSCNLPAPAVAIRCYANDYNILGVGAEYLTQVGRFPLSLWGDYVSNEAADDLNTGYAVGVKFGKASEPHSWEMGLLYQDVEADAQWAGFIDSDFAGGATQGKGLQFKGAWVPVKNTSVNLTLFDNTRNYDTSSERDYRRLQLDFNMKF
jgi:uncharacterized coiled-coil protein SlyX